jgi:excisionase family DNA binding protein
MQKLSVSLKEAEELTSISRFTIRRQIKRGVLNVARVGRRLVIPVAELEKLIRLKGNLGCGISEKG